MHDEQLEEMRTRVLLANLEDISYREWQDFKTIVDKLFKNKKDDTQITKRQIDMLKKRLKSQ